MLTEGMLLLVRQFVADRQGVLVAGSRKLFEFIATETVCVPV